jgi:hypothetical protein
MARFLARLRRQHPLWLVLAIVIVSGVVWGINGISSRSTKPAENACPVVITTIANSDQIPVTLDLSDNGKTFNIAAGTPLNVVVTYEQGNENKWELIENSNPEVVMFLQTIDNPDNV